MNRHVVRAYWFVRNGLLKTAIVGAAGMLVVALSPGPAAAAALPAIGASASSSALILALSVAPQPGKPGNLVLTSHLQGGSRNGAESVAFFVVTTEFGKDQNVPIGSAKVAGDGTARIIYTPTWSGEQQFVARLTGSAAASAPTATADYRVSTDAVGPPLCRCQPTQTIFFHGLRFPRRAPDDRCARLAHLDHHAFGGGSWPAAAGPAKHLRALLLPRGELNRNLPAPSPRKSAVMSE